MVNSDTLIGINREKAIARYIRVLFVVLECLAIHKASLACSDRRCCVPDWTAAASQTVDAAIAIDVIPHSSRFLEREIRID